MRLVLPARLQAQIAQEAKASFPRECCGLIEGVREADVARAFVLHPARNLAMRADRFEIAPQDHFAALKAARFNGRVVIGCYHSHPNGKAVPSATDLEGANEEDFLWLIASLSAKGAPPVLAGFLYSAAVFLPVAVMEADKADVDGADLVTSSLKARK